MKRIKRHARSLSKGFFFYRNVWSLVKDQSICSSHVSSHISIILVLLRSEESWTGELWCMLRRTWTQNFFKQILKPTSVLDGFSLGLKTFVGKVMSIVQVMHACCKVTSKNIDELNHLFSMKQLCWPSTSYVFSPWVQMATFLLKKLIKLSHGHHNLFFRHWDPAPLSKIGVGYSLKKLWILMDNPIHYYKNNLW